MLEGRAVRRLVRWRSDETDWWRGRLIELGGWPRDTLVVCCIRVAIIEESRVGKTLETVLRMHSLIGMIREDGNCTSGGQKNPGPRACSLAIVDGGDSYLTCPHITGSQLARHPPNAQVHPKPVVGSPTMRSRRYSPCSGQRLQVGAAVEARRDVQDPGRAGRRLRSPNPLRWWPKHWLRAHLRLQGGHELRAQVPIDPQGTRLQG